MIFRGSLGTLDIGRSGKLDPAPPATALVANGRSGEHGLKHVCNFGLESGILIRPLDGH